MTRNPISMVRGLVAAFTGAQDGNVAILFGLSLIPMIGLVGIGVDYGIAMSDKSKLDNAADAASIAAVTTAKAYVAANPSDPNLTSDAIAAGLAKASSSFLVNAGNLPFSQPPTIVTTAGAAPSPAACASGTACIYLTKTNQTFTATTVYGVATQNNFGKIFGYPTMNVAGTAAASGDVPSYLDFYLLLDVSGSMGLPSTASGLSALAAVNLDMFSDYKQGCQFACHFPGFTGWTLATTNNIQLRSGAVNSAVCSLIAQANQSAVIANQYRVGLYPFINQIATLTSLTNNLATASTAARCSSDQMTLTNMLDTGSTQLYANIDPSTGTGAGGTHFEVIFNQMQSTISSFGNGSSSTASKPFVFLVTDGMQNSQHFYTWQNSRYNYPGNPSLFLGYGAANWDGSQSAVMDPSTCAALKTAGATISVLYIPYLPISFTPNGGGVSAENTKVNGLIPGISSALTSCASPGYFYTANTPTDITNALNAMFNQAVQVAHLTR